MIALLLALNLAGGGSLDAWTAVGDVSWHIEEAAGAAATDAVITASGDGEGFLVTNAEYDDFRLTLEFWVDAGTNSGVFIRCGDRNRIHPRTCYELNIWDRHPRQEARTGAIVFRFMPPLAQVDTIGRWNRLEVEARGPHIELTINGQLTARLQDADVSGGFIALQHAERGVVKFRNIYLLPLED